MTKTIEITVEKSPVACCGDRDLPHPRVYLDLTGKDAVACPYCGKIFTLKPSHTAH